MRFIGVLVLFFLLFPSFLSAAANFVQVTQTTKKSQLRAIKSKLSKMGLKMVYKKSGSRYIVYSGPYRNSKSASYAVKKMKRYFPYAKVVAKKRKKFKPIGKSTKNEQAFLTKKLKTKDTKKMKGFFTGVSLGYSPSPSNHTVVKGTIEDLKVPNNTGISFNLDGGYHFENGFSTSLSYMKFDASDLVFDNIYGTINYRFSDFNNFVPYFGVLAGYSSLVWNVDPIKNPAEGSSNDSESFFAGSQTGIIYTGFEVVSLSFGYHCMFMGHTTNIEDGVNSSKLQHDTLHSLQIGVQYNF